MTSISQGDNSDDSGSTGLRSLETTLRAWFQVSDPEIPGLEVQKMLGTGAMGTVYQAKQMRLDRIVAVKTIRVGRLAGDAEKARFYKEANTNAGLRHPNIVTVFEAGESAGQPFFVMELMEGGTLAERLQVRAFLPAETATLIEKLATAIHYAHSLGVIHRDLKPANILLMKDGTPKVSDFSLCRLLSGVAGRDAGHLYGTPAYMAPEQATGSADVHEPADIYGLGAILYEVLTHRPPFVGTRDEVLEQVRMNAPAPPRSVRPHVDKTLEAVCLKCLEKEPTRALESQNS